MSRPCCDVTPHAAADGCLFDGCTTCGGTYPFGPSTSPECGICVQAPTLPDGDDDWVEPAPLAGPAWDERPF